MHSSFKPLPFAHNRLNVSLFNCYLFMHFIFTYVCTAWHILCILYCTLAVTPKVLHNSLVVFLILYTLFFPFVFSASICLFFLWSIFFNPSPYPSCSLLFWFLLSPFISRFYNIWLNWACKVYTIGTRILIPLIQCENYEKRKRGKPVSVDCHLFAYCLLCHSNILPHK